MKSLIDFLATIGPLGLMVEISQWARVFVPDDNFPQLPSGLLIPLHIATIVGFACFGLWLIIEWRQGFPSFRQKK
jgi:hypothetical protein